MPGFLDFIDSYVPGGAAAVPSWLTGLLVRKPSMNPEAALPYYQAIAGSAGRSNDFADAAAGFTTRNYMPAAVTFNNRAQGVGMGADLNEAADRGGANFRSAFHARRGAVMRDMAGRNPNSGGAQARLGALDASFAPGMVHAMNTGRNEREKYGDTLRATALPFLNMQPNYGPGMSGYALAGRGSSMVGDDLYRRYRDEAGDTARALRIPGDRADDQRRQQEQQASMQRIFDSIRQRFSFGDLPGGPTPYYGSSASWAGDD
jgi:hypothetical protein